MSTPRQDAAGYYTRAGAHARPFRDRSDAGAKLASALHAYHGSNPLVVAVPRGGVPIGYEIAKQLDGDLDVIVARKVGAPRQPELAIGAVASDGACWIHAKLRTWAAVSDAVLARMIEQERALAEASEQSLRAGLPALQPAGRIVILVDDGLATGATLRAALRSLRARGAGHLVVAVPVGAADACNAIAHDVDQLVCLHRPEAFHAVGEHYDHFDQTSYEQVEQLLRKQRERRGASFEAKR